MTGKRPEQRTVGPWIYPKFAEVLSAARLKLMATYIRWRRHTIANTIKRQNHQWTDPTRGMQGDKKKTWEPTPPIFLGPGDGAARGG